MRYELQTYDGKRWRLEMIYDDQALAIADARSLMSGARRPKAVQVVESEDDGRRVFLRRQNTPETLFEIRRRLHKEADAHERDRKKELRERHLSRQAADKRRRRIRAIAVCSLIASIMVLAASARLYLLP
jgi:hypothetical protein